MGLSPTGKRRLRTAHVESRCGAVALGRACLFAAPFVWRCLSGSTVAPFPHPAHRWGRGLARQFRPKFVFPVGSLFRLRVSHHLGRATFPAPAASNAACGFPALRSPVCFASRLMGPILPERLSVLVEPLGSHRTASEFGSAIPYSTAPSRSLVGSGLAPGRTSPELPGRVGLRLDVYSPPQVLQIDGRLCHLVLTFLVVGDFTNSRVPSLHGRYPASTLLRTHPSPSRLRSTSRLSRLYDRPCSGDFALGRGGLLQLLGMSLPPCCRFHPAEVKEPHRSDFGSPMQPSPSG